MKPLQHSRPSFVSFVETENNSSEFDTSLTGAYAASALLSALDFCRFTNCSLLYVLRTSFDKSLSTAYVTEKKAAKCTKNSPPQNQPAHKNKNKNQKWAQLQGTLSCCSNWACKPWRRFKWLCKFVSSSCGLRLLVLGVKGDYCILKVLQPCEHPGHFPIVSWWRGKEPRNFWEIKHSAFIHSTHILNILMWNSIIWIDVIFGRIWPPPCCISANFLPITPKTQIHAVPGTSSTGLAHWSPRYQAVVPSVGRSSAPKQRPWYSMVWVVQIILAKL